MMSPLLSNAYAQIATVANNSLFPSSKVDPPAWSEHLLIA